MRHSQAPHSPTCGRVPAAQQVGRQRVLRLLAPLRQQVLQQLPHHAVKLAEGALDAAQAGQRGDPGVERVHHEVLQARGWHIGEP